MLPWQRGAKQVRVILVHYFGYVLLSGDDVSIMAYGENSILALTVACMTVKESGVGIPFLKAKNARPLPCDRPLQRAQAQQLSRRYNYMSYIAVASHYKSVVA